MTKKCCRNFLFRFRFLLRPNVKNLKSELVALITGLNMAKYFQLSWMVGTLTGMF